MKFDTIKDAARHWVGEFNAIPYGVVEKLMKLDIDDVVEITPPSVNDYVYICDGEHNGEHGEIIKHSDEDESLYIIRIDGSDEEIELSDHEFDVEKDSDLPMWGTFWSFGDSCDEWWLKEDGGLQIMADCGFRIYEQEDYGYLFGIDGAGYDFYEKHWIPLYKARGLHWHREEEREVA